jgi:hypothetical protein
MDIDQFMAANPPPKRRSPLWKHEAALRKLRASGHTIAQIQLYLKSNGIHCSNERVTTFIVHDLGLRKNTPASEIPSQPITRQEVRRHAPQTLNPTPAPTPAPSDEPSSQQMAEYAELARLGRKSTQ